MPSLKFAIIFGNVSKQLRRVQISERTGFRSVLTVRPNRASHIYTSSHSRSFTGHIHARVSMNSGKRWKRKEVRASVPRATIASNTPRICKFVADVWIKDVTYFERKCAIGLLYRESQRSHRDHISVNHGGRHETNSQNLQWRTLMQIVPRFSNKTAQSSQKTRHFKRFFSEKGTYPPPQARPPGGHLH